MQHKISVDLKAHVEEGWAEIWVSGIGETKAVLSPTGMHARKLNLRNNDKVRLTLERLRK